MAVSLCMVLSCCLSSIPRQSSAIIFMTCSCISCAACRSFCKVSKRSLVRPSSAVISSVSSSRKVLVCSIMLAIRASADWSMSLRSFFVSLSNSALMASSLSSVLSCCRSSIPRQSSAIMFMARSCVSCAACMSFCNVSKRSFVPPSSAAISFVNSCRSCPVCSTMLAMSLQSLLVSLLMSALIAASLCMTLSCCRSNMPRQSSAIMFMACSCVWWISSVSSCKVSKRASIDAS
mmetsp:Transcript_2310/g.5245  ORF Transcript_2310/g.5245 Transcript_2310/m.5245 type:complete len:234 (-) Transcript_2310:160-861(-)